MCIFIFNLCIANDILVIFGSLKSNCSYMEIYNIILSSFSLFLRRQNMLKLLIFRLCKTVNHLFQLYDKKWLYLCIYDDLLGSTL